MTEKNKEILRELAAKSGCRKDKMIADKIGMDPATFSRKLSGKSSFTIPEIKLMMEAFSIKRETAALLFL